MLYRDVIEKETKQGMSVVDITKDVTAVIEKSGVREGTCNVFLPHTTAGLMLNEHERMLLEDFKKFFAAVDEKKIYHHPSNAFAHLRATMAKSDITFPIADRKAVLGTWQSILLWNFDNEERKRTIVVTVIGD